MARMKIMLSILGEGRGHITQAISVEEMVEKAGHQVVAISLGMASHREVPSFFPCAVQMPITRIETLEFSVKHDRKVSLPATVASVVRKLPAYWRSLRKLRAIV